MSSPSITKISVGYSATVRMRLIVGTQHLPVAQVGPDFVILKKPVDLAPSRAELVVQIDETEKRRTIYLPQGIRAADLETRVTSV